MTEHDHTKQQPEAEPMETESDRLRDAVRKAIRQGENVLTAEEAAALDLGKTTIHQVMVKRRQESYAALQAYGDARAREQDAKIAALERARDNWQEEARVRAQNTDFWRQNAEALEAERDRLRAALANTTSLIGQMYHAPVIVDAVLKQAQAALEGTE